MEGACFSHTSCECKLQASSTPWQEEKQVSTDESCCACHDENDDVYDDNDSVLAKCAAIASSAATNVNGSARVCLKVKERCKKFFATNGKFKDAKRSAHHAFSTRTRTHTHSSSSRSRKNSSSSDKYISVGFLHDSGSNTHLTNIKGVLQNIQKCKLLMCLEYPVMMSTAQFTQVRWEVSLFTWIMMIL